MNWHELHQRILQADKILLTTHENPDGDGLGSAAAMYHFLHHFDVQCRIINVSPLPEEFQYLNDGNIFETYNSADHESWIQNVDLVLIFDVGDFDRLRAIKDVIVAKKLETINIDHHPYPDETPFTIDVVNTGAAATGEILFDYFSAVAPETLTRVVCDGIYTAVLTDTGSFRYSNTTARCHEVAIACIKAGVNHTAIYQHIYETNSLPRVKLLGQVLNNLRLDVKGELAWFIVDQKMLERASASREDVDGFTDFVRTIRGVEVALMIFEQNETTCRINFRSKGKYVVNKIAGTFGGGGHQLAAGAVIPGKLEAVTQKVLEETKRQIISQNGRVS